MANIKSAAKRARKSKVRAMRNRAVKSNLKTTIKRFEEALQKANTEDAKILLNNAIKTIDKAAAKGVIHQNNAAHKKSRLTKAFNKFAS